MELVRDVAATLASMGAPTVPLFRTTTLGAPTDVHYSVAKIADVWPVGVDDPDRWQRILGRLPGPAVSVDGRLFECGWHLLPVRCRVHPGMLDYTSRNRWGKEEDKHMYLDELGPSDLRGEMTETKLITAYPNYRGYHPDATAERLAAAVFHYERHPNPPSHVN